MAEMLHLRPHPQANQCAGPTPPAPCPLRGEVHAAEEGLEASAIRRGGAEMRALGLNHWEDKQLQWIVSVVTR